MYILSFISLLLTVLEMQDFEIINRMAVLLVVWSQKLNSGNFNATYTHKQNFAALSLVVSLNRKVIVIVIIACLVLYNTTLGYVSKRLKIRVPGF